MLTSITAKLVRWLHRHRILSVVMSLSSRQPDSDHRPPNPLAAFSQNTQILFSTTSLSFVTYTNNDNDVDDDDDDDANDYKDGGDDDMNNHNIITKTVAILIITIMITRISTDNTDSTQNKRFRRDLIPGGGTLIFFRRVWRPELWRKGVLWIRPVGQTSRHDKTYCTGDYGTARSR